MSKENDRKKRKRREKKLALRPKPVIIIYDDKPEPGIEDDKYGNESEPEYHPSDVGYSIGR